MIGNETMRIVQQERSKGKSTVLFLVLGLAAFAAGMWLGSGALVAAGTAVMLGAFFLQPGLRKRLGGCSFRSLSGKLRPGEEIE